MNDEELDKLLADLGARQVQLASVEKKIMNQLRGSLRRQKRRKVMRVLTFAFAIPTCAALYIYILKSYIFVEGTSNYILVITAAAGLVFLSMMCKYIFDFSIENN